MERLESSIERQIIKELRKRPKTYSYKHPPIPVGFPDIEHKERGRTFLFEVKRSKTHKATPIQKYVHKQLKKTGNKVWIVWSWKQVKKILKKELK